MAAWRNKQGFSAVRALLILILVSMLGFTGWFVWHAQQSADKTASSNAIASVNSFAACKKAAGSKTLTTYPEQCVTKDGKTFTDLGQRVKYLVITEWGVKFPLTADISDATYAVATTSVDANSETVGLSVPSAAAVSADCAPNKLGLAAIVRQTAAIHDANVGKANTQEDPHPVYPKKIGNYYYQYHESTGVTPTANHPSGTCGDYASGLQYAKSFQTAINQMVAAE